MEFSKKGSKVGNKFNFKQRALLLAVMRVSLARVTGPAGCAGLVRPLLGQGGAKAKGWTQRRRDFWSQRHSMIDCFHHMFRVTNLPDSVPPANQIGITISLLPPSASLICWGPQSTKRHTMSLQKAINNNTWYLHCISTQMKEKQT